MMTAELELMNNEVTAVESDMRGLRLESTTNKSDPLDSSQQVPGSRESPSPGSRAHQPADGGSNGSSRSSSTNGYSRSGLGGSHSPARKRVSFRSQSPGAVGSGLDVDIREHSKVSSTSSET